MTGLTSTAMPSAGDGYNLDVITAVYLGGNSASGGEGSVWRTFMGILIIGILNNGMALFAVDLITDFCKRVFVNYSCDI